MVRGRRIKEREQENEPLTKVELAEFKALLVEKRESVIAPGNAVQRGMDASNDKLPDEVDLATAEYEAAFEYRLRDREKYLVKKIDKALRRIEEGDYDECESCGSVIAKKRLLARPEATLCIMCKEEQEQIEKGFLKKREIREEDFTF
jgi:DnaK suppressor protein